MPQNTAANTPARELRAPIEAAGLVVHGEKVGRTIGFPTANLDISTEVASTLEPGVYFGTCRISGKTQTWSCLPYFGPRFIFGEKNNVFEVFIYDFNQNIYDQMVEVTLTHYLRGPMDIRSLEHLQQQLTIDKETGKTLITKRSTITL
jgi:riboflavin kinase/FMN adenylyltransferase